MTNKFMGEGLIFITSQPRSGSTLLQRVLADSPDVQTSAETWLMLHPVYANKGVERIQTGYNSSWAHEAVEEFLDNYRYGHEDHVLVYRVLKTLQADFHYDLWFSNYSSNRSINFMNHYISGFGAKYECLPVNLPLVNEIAEIYKKNGCWTWYEDYQWFGQECLIRETPGAIESGQLPYGHSFPINYIKIDFGIHNPKQNRFAKIASRLQRKLKK